MTPADLKSARHALGYSVNEMADALRLGANGHTAIREMERGKREISGPVSVAVELMLALASDPTHEMTAPLVPVAEDRTPQIKAWRAMGGALLEERLAIQ